MPRYAVAERKPADSDDATDIASFSKYYFGDAATANPYHYGLVPEVKVNRQGAHPWSSTTRLAASRARCRRWLPTTARPIGGDDGKNTGLFMFVADKRQDLSAGTLYAAKSPDQRRQRRCLRPAVDQAGPRF